MIEYESPITVKRVMLGHCECKQGGVSRRRTIVKLAGTHQSSPCDTVHVVLDAKDGARSRSEDEELDVVEDQGNDLQQSSSSSSERGRDLSGVEKVSVRLRVLEEVRQAYKVGEEEGRGSGELGREEGDGAARVLGDGGDGVDQSTGEGDDEETVNHEEHEVAGHEGQLDAGLERDSLEASEHCAAETSAAIGWL